MKHINQVEVTIPAESDDFLEHATNWNERCVSVGGLAHDLGLLKDTHPRGEFNTDLRLKVATRLQSARERAGLTRGQVDKLLNLEAGTLSKVEEGSRSVAIEEVPKFAAMYGVDISWLIGSHAEESREGRLALAVRELDKIKGEDLDRIIALLSSLRSAKEVTL